jgi:hypothetical protein
VVIINLGFTLELEVMAIKFNTPQQSGEDYSPVPRKREIPQKWALFKSKC